MSAAKLQLTEMPEPAEWPETHYVFIEKIGPFQTNAPQAWQEAHALEPALAQSNAITGAMSLYKMQQQVYRAGYILAAPPKNLPEGWRYELFPGGKYVRFMLKGPYSNLPEASCHVFQIVQERKIPLRDDYSIENYANDPRVTPQDELITEIYFPTK